MSDLISRSSIYNYIKAQINPYGKPFKGTAYELGLKIMDYIKNMSSVELPVRGEWINTDGYDEWECSECGYQDCGYDEYPTNGKSGLNFCPNCGADMRKKVAE